MAWTTPTAITSSTKISDTDNIIEANAQDLEAYVNGVAPYVGVGLTANMVDKTTAQTITAQKTFSSAIVASGGVTGDLTGSVTGNVTGNADTSTDSLALNGEVVTDSVVSTSTTIPASLNSAKTAYDKGVEAEGIADTKILPTDYASLDGTTGGTVKMRVSGGVLYIRNDGTNA